MKLPENCNRAHERMSKCGLFMAQSLLRNFSWPETIISYLCHPLILAKYILTFQIMIK